MSIPIDGIFDSMESLYMALSGQKSLVTRMMMRKNRILRPLSSRSSRP